MYIYMYAIIINAAALLDIIIDTIGMLCAANTHIAFIYEAYYYTYVYEQIYIFFQILL